MKRNRIVLFIIAIAITGFFWFENSKTKIEPFVFGFIPSERAEEITPKAQVLANFLEERIGREVEIVVPTDYEVLIEGLRFGHIDAAYMDSGPAWLAYTKANAEVVLAELKDGEPFYYGEVYVKKGSDIKNLKDVKGKKIAFTSWTGSSGFVFPVGVMIKEGIINPTSDDFFSLESALSETFSLHTISGGYKQSLELLLNDTVDVIGGPHDLAERFLPEEERDTIVSLKRLGKVPSHPIMIASHVSKDLKDLFVKSMLELNSEENIEIIKNLYGVDGLIDANSQNHLGDFGPAFEAVVGIHDKI